MTKLIPVFALLLSCTVILGGCKEEGKGYDDDNSLGKKVEGIYNIIYTVDNSIPKTAMLTITNSKGVSIYMKFHKPLASGRADISQPMPSDLNVFVGTTVVGTEGNVSFTTKSDITGIPDHQILDIYLEGVEYKQIKVATSGKLEYYYAPELSRATGPHASEYRVSGTITVTPKGYAEGEEWIQPDDIIIEFKDIRNITE